MKTTAFFLRPLDQLFFRDGRAFGAASRAVSGLPNPTTLSGALRTLLLSNHHADFDRLGQSIRNGASMEEAFRVAGAPDWIAGIRVRGPWLAQMAAKTPTVYFRRPRNLRPLGDRTFAPSQPMRCPLPGWKSQEGLAPLWCSRASREKETDLPDLLTSKSLAAFLNGQPLQAEALRPQKDLVKWQDKTGIQVDPHTLTAQDQMIYAVRMLALADDAGFYCEVTSEQPLPTSPFSFPFGGESRYVHAEPVNPINWPSAPPGPNRLVYLLSPGLFRNVWKPDTAPSDATLRAAAVDGPFAVSGWDLARGGPKPTRFGVQPGSVYFYEGGAAFPDSLCADPADTRQGYGVFLQGVWKYV